MPIKVKKKIGSKLLPLTQFWGVLYNQHPKQALENNLRGIKNAKTLSPFADGITEYLESSREFYENLW